MPTRDLHSNIKVVQHVTAQAISATNTPSNGVDLKECVAAEFIISVGAMANIQNSPQPTFTFKLQDSDDDSTYSDVTDSNYVLTGSARSGVSAPDSSTGVFLTIGDTSAGHTDDENSFRVGYVGPKRYARVVATAANTPGSTPYSVVAVLTPHQTPAAD